MFNRPGAGLYQRTVWPVQLSKMSRDVLTTAGPLVDLSEVNKKMVSLWSPRESVWS